jgi:hypothetical protein
VRAGFLPLPLVAFATVAVMTLCPVWGHLDAGWPFSHEGPAFAQRTLIYAEHFRSFDFAPIWSSADNDGFGSPMPLMYHKLFYLVAAPLFLATGSMNAGLLLALFAMLVVGALGMYRLMNALGASALGATFAGTALIVANYTVTNWMVRGNVAEMSAAMMVPWVLEAFMRSMAQRRVTVGLGTSLALVWLGHSVLAYFLALLLAAAFLLCLPVKITTWSMLDPRWLWRPVAVFAGVLLPFVVPMLVVGRDYQFDRILTPPFLPEYQFRPLGWYVWDTHWHFGRTVAGLTLQLDPPMLALAAVGAIVVFSRFGHGATRELGARVFPIAVVFLLALVLQLPWTARLYHWIPGALYIQFPWRLLAVMTPTLIATAIYLADRGLQGDVRMFSLGAASAWMLATCGAFVPIQDPRLSLTAPSVAGASFSGFREYEPASAPPRQQMLDAMARYWRHLECDVQRIDPPGEERLEVSWRTRCARGSVVPLPIYASGIHRVISSGFARSQSCAALAAFPTACGATVTSGDNVVTVRMPTLAAAAGKLWR